MWSASLRRRGRRAVVVLGWTHKTSFDALVKDMVEADMVAILEEQKRRNRNA